MTDQQLFEDMARHPAIAPVFSMLEMADGSDEFSRALRLVRDCFAENQTQRILARNRLQGMMKTRIMLAMNFEVAVVQAAKARGANPSDFGEAMDALPSEVMRELQRDYDQQVEALKARPLER